MDNNRKNGEVSFGGGENRLIYEGKKRKESKFILFLAAVAVVLFAFLAVVGIVSIVNGAVFAGSGIIPSQIKVQAKNTGESKKNISDIIYEVGNCAITVSIKLKDGTVLQKAGFFVSNDGYLVTEFDGSFADGSCESITISYMDDTPIPVSIAGYIDSVGIAFLKWDYKSITDSTIFSVPVIKTANSSYVKVADSVMSIPPSANDAFEGYFVRGEVSRISKLQFGFGEEKRNFSVIFTDFETSGIPGAPLLNENGDLIGMCSSLITTPSGIGAAIPINTIILLGNDIIKS